MRGPALLAIIAWQFSLAEPQSDERDESYSNGPLSMLMPLFLRSGAESAGRTSSSEEEQAFSAIPSYAFTLDEDMSSPAALPASARVALRLGGAPDLLTPRSIYLEDEENAIDTEAADAERELRRACSRLKVGAPELLLVLCTELLDAPPLTPPRAPLTAPLTAPPPPPPAPRACPCCGAELSTPQHTQQFSSASPFSDKYDLVRQFTKFKIFST